MKQNILLISIDGMRADAARQTQHPFLAYLMQQGCYTYGGSTVFPSVTLPAHMSMMHSIPPERHGILTNQYVPPVRPVNGIFEQAFMAGRRCAMFTNWVELRDIVSPGCLIQQFCISNKQYKRNTDTTVAEAAASCLREGVADFVFVHLVATDHVGHAKGWCSPEYYEALNHALTLAEELYEIGKEHYTLLLTADHGGHDRIHGTAMPEDMTTPFFAIGEFTARGELTEHVSILDIAPTVAGLLEIPLCEDWEGNILRLSNH